MSSDAHSQFDDCPTIHLGCNGTIMGNGYDGGEVGEIDYTYDEVTRSFTNKNDKLSKENCLEANKSDYYLDDDDDDSCSDDEDVKPVIEDVKINEEDVKLLLSENHIKSEEIKEELILKPEDIKVEKDDSVIKPEEIKEEDEHVSDVEVKEDEEDELSSDDDLSESDEEEVNPRAKLRRRRVDRVSLAAINKRNLYRRIGQIVRKCSQTGVKRTKEEDKLYSKHPKIVKDILKRLNRQQIVEDRKKEIEDSPLKFAKNCTKLAKAIQKAKYLVVYTGAGISTAANIPDYRGPNGVWTLLEKGQEVEEFDLEAAEPTFTHMALYTLFKKGKLKHVVSQNCDGLHLRSGIPRYALSEVHGNMFVEVCKRCKPMRPFLRLFDVTEKTNRNRHATGRRCHICGQGLFDTIVHFGERSHFKWPINWEGAVKAAEKADMILCLGSSLKVLRRYPWLWFMDRPKKERPPLYIVNLQWTPKDGAATLKLNGRCDEIMKRVMSLLGYEVPMYYGPNDPLLTYATPLHAMEAHTTTRQVMVGQASSDFRVRSWSLDHAYTNKKYSDAENDDLEKEDTIPISKSRAARRRGCLAQSKGVDYRSVAWPRDALYCSYRELRFEYINELESEGRTGYYCACCDPAFKRKRRSSDSEQDQDEDEEDNTDDDQDDLASKSSESLSKTDSVDRNDEDSRSEKPTPTSKPGWFGKGRKIKKIRT